MFCWNSKQGEKDVVIPIPNTDNTGLFVLPRFVLCGLYNTLPDVNILRSKAVIGFIRYLLILWLIWFSSGCCQTLRKSRIHHIIFLIYFQWSGLTDNF